jgi:hypothetical protein
LIAAVASVNSPALINAVSDREAGTQRVRPESLCIEARFSLGAHTRGPGSSCLTDWGTFAILLYADVQRARAELVKHVTSIEVVP